MKVIGFRKSSFKGDDGSQVSGVNLYLTEKCEKGEGLSCERVYITDQRLNACGYVPKLGDEIAYLGRLPVRFTSRKEPTALAVNVGRMCTVRAALNRSE